MGVAMVEAGGRLRGIFEDVGPVRNVAVWPHIFSWLVHGLAVALVLLVGLYVPPSLQEPERPVIIVDPPAQPQGDHPPAKRPTHPVPVVPDFLPGPPKPILVDQLQLEAAAASTLELFRRQRAFLGFQDNKDGRLVSHIYEWVGDVRWRRRQDLPAVKDRDYYAVELTTAGRAPQIQALIERTPELGGRHVYALFSTNFGDKLEAAAAARRHSDCPSSAAALAVVELTPDTEAGFRVLRTGCGPPLSATQ
jgi:hypothetical protein